mgnify:CR=1 FL=1
MITSIPLEHLTNKKIREIYFDSKEFTFLTFGCNHPKREYKVEQMFHRKFMSFPSSIKVLMKGRALFEGLKQL